VCCNASCSVLQCEALLQCVLQCVTVCVAMCIAESYTVCCSEL